MNPIRATIRGNRYDTAAADQIGRAVQGGEGWHVYSERLYSTRRSGRLFLAGSGGPLTVYGSTDGAGKRVHGSAIIPLTATAAAEWAKASNNLPALEALAARRQADAASAAPSASGSSA